MTNDESNTVTAAAGIAAQNPLDHYWSPFFVLGLLIVAAYVWRRFNEPSFPNQKALPHALVPLRYLFLKPAYQRARFAYLLASLSLYCLLVWPGPSIVPALRIVGIKDFPAEGWALLVAIFLTGVGVAPESLKWLNVVDEQLRRWIHAWFLVPDGIEKTIGVLEDALYEPPPSQLNLVPSPLREKLRDDLKAPPETLRYRLARATMLMASLKQMGNGAAHPLKRAAFDPFKEDFDAIRKSFRALPRDAGPPGGDRTDEDTEENLIGAVDDLLKQIYAYISWGIRSQADSEQEVDRTLRELGFRVPQRGGRRLFDIVAPAVGLVACITIAFWLIVDTVSRTIGAPAPPMSDSVVFALTSAIAAMVMYGRAAFIALKRRAAQIEQKDWREGSPRCLIPIAFSAGLVAWVVIIISTVPGQFLLTWRSLVGLAHLVSSIAGGDAATAQTYAEWSFFPIRIVTALPWFLAGATVSVVLACSVGGDVRRTDQRQRIHDAVVLGICLGLAAASAQLIQTALSESMFNEANRPTYGLVPILGLAGFACGSVIGFLVPHACRANIVTPLDPALARALRELLAQAEAALGSLDAAKNWVFTPHDELRGITPAEAVQYQGLATGMFRLLDTEAPRIREEVGSGPSDRPMPFVIDGGRSA
jgi:hypothetical protein